MKRRLLRWLVAPLLIGAMTTIAVAWTLAARLPQSDWRESVEFGQTPRQTAFSVKSYRAPGAVRRVWEIHPPLQFGGAINNPPGGGRPDFPAGPLSRVIAWGRAAHVRDDPPSLPLEGCEHATGWPVLAGWYGIVQPSLNVFSVTGGFVVEDRGLLWDLRALPLHPIWPGLVLDTVFYGALWLLLRAAFASTRASWRRRHNRCADCGYSLAGLPAAGDAPAPCPECGALQRRIR